MNKGLFTQAQRQFLDLGRPVRIFLLVNVLEGVILSMWMLIFNFYILELGFDRPYLGLVNSAASIASLVFGIPLGILSDRIGRKKALLIGVGVYVLAATLELMATHPFLLLCMAFLSGTGRMLYFLNVAPFLTSASKPENRTFLFSLNFGLVILAGAFGNLFASRLAAWFVANRQVAVTSVTAYRGTLLFAVSLSYLVLMLLAYIPDIRSENPDHVASTKRSIQSGGRLVTSLQELLSQPVIRQLALVQLVFGFGVAILTPYMNLYFDEKFQVSPQALGGIFSVKALFTGVAAFLMPRLVQKMGGRIRVVFIFLFLGGISRLVLGFSSALELAVGAFLLSSIFSSTPIPLVEAFSMEQVDKCQRATLGSVRELSWQASWSIGPYLSGSLQDRFGFSPVFVLSFIAIWLAALMNQVFFEKREKQGCMISRLG